MPRQSEQFASRMALKSLKTFNFISMDRSWKGESVQTFYEHTGRMASTRRWVDDRSEAPICYQFNVLEPSTQGSLAGTDGILYGAHFS